MSLVDPLGLKGKSVLWLVGDVNTDPNAQDMQSVFTIVRNIFIAKDKETAGSSDPTHFLDDGNKFEIAFVTTMTGLGNIGGYDRIFYVGHGNTNGGICVENTLCTPGAITNANASIVSVEGCINGVRSTGEIVLGTNLDGTVDGWWFETSRYLRE